MRGNVEDGVARGARPDGALQRALDELLRRDGGRVRAAAGPDRRGRRLEPRHADRHGDGRAAPAAGRLRASPTSPAASAAASRCAGCCCRAPDLLLLDEPTNHLDAESVAWLEQHLAEYKGAIVAVTHDRYFLDNVAQWILEIDRSRGIPYEGNYSAWLEQKQKRLLAGGAQGVLALAHDRRRARVGAHEPEGPPRQEQGAPRPLRGPASPRTATSSSTRSRSTSRPASGSATRSSRPRTCARASATSCSSTTCPSRCRPRASSA